MDGAALTRLLPGRYPLPLVDRVERLDPGERIVATKTVTSGEPFFAGHFPGLPLMPGVLLCEALAQAGALLVAEEARVGGDPVLRMTGLDRARFRIPVVPGDRLELDVRVVRRDIPHWRLRGVARVGTQIAAEADFRFEESAGSTNVHVTAVVAPGAVLAAGVVVGPYAVIGPQVTIGAGTTVGPHAVIEGRTTIGEQNRIFQFASIGAEPQDLKYAGEESRLEIGNRNTIREFATLNPGTAGGGMITRIGDDNLVMNYAHIGHDSLIGNHCVFANSAALAGHVIVEDWVIVGGLAAIQQFVRIGESAFLGGGAMVVLDVPPFCTATGDRARLRGLNLVGLRRRGFDAERVRALKNAYRVLFGGAERFAAARERCAAELGTQRDVAQLLAFLEGSERGVSSARARGDAG